jgi:hypothetical protein
MPRPILTNRTVGVLNKGLLYIHGRCMDMTPIVILDFIKLEEMIDSGEIDPPTYCNLFNFVGTYV